MGSLNKGVLSYLKISGHNRAEHVHKDLVMTQQYMVNTNPCHEAH